MDDIDLSYDNQKRVDRMLTEFIKKVDEAYDDLLKKETKLFKRKEVKLKIAHELREASGKYEPTRK